MLEMLWEGAMLPIFLVTLTFGHRAGYLCNRLCSNPRPNAGVPTAFHGNWAAVN